MTAGPGTSGRTHVARLVVYRDRECAFGKLGLAAQGDPTDQRDSTRS